MEIVYHGHSCFQLNSGDTSVLIDPFLKPNNPVAELTAEQVDPTHVVVTHGHVDHIADAVGVAKRTGAPTVAVVEVANWLQAQGLENVSDPNIGGTVRFDWGWVKMMPAIHTNTLPDGTVVGMPAGAIIHLHGVTVYHLGDTALFSDLRLAGRRTPIDVAIVPIGGHYTMDRHDAVDAVEFVGAPTVIPCHYNTFPPIETDAEAFKDDVEESTGSTVVVLDPGQSYVTDQALAGR